jgi:hypothetical protein
MAQLNCQSQSQSQHFCHSKLTVFVFFFTPRWRGRPFRAGFTVKFTFFIKTFKKNLNKLFVLRCGECKRFSVHFM